MLNKNKMELIIITILYIIALIIVTLIFRINVKKLKKLAMDEELNKLASKYPSNIDICKKILKKIKNENVQIEENPNSEATLYLAMQNKIIIADVKGSFTRIQTIAHECLHSIQDKKMLIFNFIYSNIYMVTFAIFIILAIFKKIPNKLLFSNTILLLGVIYYAVRVFLENDAMIKARFLAKEYMEEEKITSNEETQKIVDGFDKVNNECIKSTNYSLFVNIITKVILFNIVALIF